VDQEGTQLVSVTFQSIIMMSQLRVLSFNVL